MGTFYRKYRVALDPKLGDVNSKMHANYCTNRLNQTEGALFSLLSCSWVSTFHAYLVQRINYCQLKDEKGTLKATEHDTYENIAGSD
jgi:hypothetical protein